MPTPAPYAVIPVRAVDKDLSRLSREVKQRIVGAMDALSEDPRPSGAEHVTGHAHRYRVRVGDYRIVYDIDDRARDVTIVIVGHRRDVYDRMRRRL